MINQLRIGNWIWATGRNQHETKPIQVSPETFKIMERSPGKYFAPVKLTVDILLIAGFEKSLYGKKEQWLGPEFLRVQPFTKIRMGIMNDPFLFFDAGLTNIKLDWLHTLQNLYFVLTETELEIKL